MKTSEILTKAADIIEAQGWVKGEQGTVVGEGPKCLMGAVAQAAGMTTFPAAWRDQEHYSYTGLYDHPAGKALVEHMGVADSDHLWKFNDAAEGVNDVLEVLRAAALVEAGREDYADPLQLGMARLGIYEES